MTDVGTIEADLQSTPLWSRWTESQSLLSPGSHPWPSIGCDQAGDIDESNHRYSWDLNVKWEDDLRIHDLERQRLDEHVAYSWAGIWR